MATLKYSIEKTDSDGEYGAYLLTYSLEDTQTVLLQKEAILMTKEDTDGTKSTQSINVPASSIVSFKNQKVTTPSAAQRYNGFAVNVSDANLAIGGTYYEIESTSGTYASSNSSSELEAL